VASTAVLNELDLFSSGGLCIGVEHPHWRCFVFFIAFTFVYTRCGVARPSDSGDSERMTKEVVIKEEEGSFGDRFGDIPESPVRARSIALFDDELDLFSRGGLRIIGPCRYGPIENRGPEYWNRLTDNWTYSLLKPVQVVHIHTSILQKVRYLFILFSFSNRSHHSRKTLLHPLDPTLNCHHPH
jgi:hypothetical protein